jgi:transcriptional regulator with XRE-family HTH domain
MLNERKILKIVLTTRSMSGILYKTLNERDAIYKEVLKMTIAERIKQARLKAGLTQKELSEKYRIPLRSIQQWEEGSRKPPEYVIDLLVRCLELDFNHELAEHEQDLSAPKQLIFTDHIGKPLKEPVLSAFPDQDDAQVDPYDTLTTAYDDVDNPITDEVLAELEKLTYD